MPDHDGCTYTKLSFDRQEGRFLNWHHVLLESPLSHVEPLSSHYVRIYGKGGHNRSGLLSRPLLDPSGSSVRVGLQEVQIGAALVLYGGTIGWERSFELRLCGEVLSVVCVDECGQEEQFARFTSGKGRYVLQIDRHGDDFTCLLDGEVLWCGSLPFALPPARVLLRAIGDLHNEGRERSACFGPVELRGLLSEEVLQGTVQDERGRPVPGAWLHWAGDGFFEAISDANGRFHIPYVPHFHQSLICGARGIGFSKVELDEPPACLADDAGFTLRLSREKTPRPEYPRPDFDRSDWWHSLNGIWGFALDPAGVGLAQNWPVKEEPFKRVIRVPFPWTSLMAVGEEDFACGHRYTGIWGGYTGTAWYRRKVRIPEDFPGDTLVLKFDAVNHDAHVFWDGQEVAWHSGGFDPFECVLPGAVPGSVHTLVVKVHYPHEIEPTEILVGKQGWWFTHAPGIWQSVWLESRSKVGWLTRFHLEPQVDFASDGPEPDCAFRVRIATAGSCDQLAVQLRDATGAIVQNRSISGLPGSLSSDLCLKVPEPKLWEPNNPHLYSAEATLYRQGQVVDRVRTYCGLRQVRCDWAPGHGPQDGVPKEEQYQYVYLNNRPIYLAGVLDQAYNPWGVYTYPAYGPEEAAGSILFDLAAAKRLGYNLIRLHIKANEPLWLYAAARYGLLVWDEIPNYRGTPFGPGFQRWQRQAKAQHERDFNCPAIIIRSLFNESWGVRDMRTNPATQELILEEVARQRAREPHRLVVDNSAAQGYPNRHLDTDLNDEHIYERDWWQWRAVLQKLQSQLFPGSAYNFHNTCHEPDEAGGFYQAGQPYVMSEFTSGGGKARLLRRFPKVAGYVVVNLADQEWERFAALTYDRQYKAIHSVDEEFQPLEPAMEHSLDAVVLDTPPSGALQPGGTTAVTVYVAPFARQGCSNQLSLGYRIVAEVGKERLLLESEQAPISVAPYSVTHLGEIRVTRPQEAQRVWLFVWLERGAQRTACASVHWDG